MSEDFPKTPERLRRLDENILTPEEFLFISATPSLYKESGRPISEIVRTLLDKIAQGDEDALRELSTPIHLQRRTMALEDVNKERFAVSEAKVVRGALGILDEGQIRLSIDQRVEPYIELGLVDKETGIIVPEWKIGLVGLGDAPIRDGNLLRKLEVREDLKEFYTLGEPGENGLRVLRRS